MANATDVIRDIDQLRRDLSGYHGHLVAHNELQRHCENQRKMLAELQLAQKTLKDERDEFADENAKLRELVRDMYSYVFNRELGMEVDE